MTDQKKKKKTDMTSDDPTKWLLPTPTYGIFSEI